MVKHTPLILKKKCEITFEILRSEITFLMDLYITEGNDKHKTHHFGTVSKKLLDSLN